MNLQGNRASTILADDAPLEQVLSRLDGWVRIPADELLDTSKPVAAREKAFETLLRAPLSDRAKVGPDEAEAISIVLARSGLSRSPLMDTPSLDGQGFKPR